MFKYLSIYIFNSSLETSEKVANFTDGSFAQKTLLIMLFTKPNPTH